MTKPSPMAVCIDCYNAHAADDCEDLRCVHYRRAFRLRTTHERCKYCGS